MNNYSTIPFLSSFALETDYTNRVIPRLIDIWLDDYAGLTPNNDIIETRTSAFSYLFDVAHGRLLAAWGFSQGKNTEPRPKARMAGSPLSDGPNYHRGHAIPHTLGGPTDINLVPQLGSVNVGPFRVLEREAVATPGALYFTYWKYTGNTDSQKPIGVEQGLMVPGRILEVREHGN